MRIERFLNRPSTIWTVTQSETDEDEYGNPVDAEPSATAALCYFAPWAQQAGTEQNVDRATTSDDWLYIVAEGTPLASTDHVEIDGEAGTFEVVGVPTAEWNALIGSMSHVAARLRRTTR